MESLGHSESAPKTPERGEALPSREESRRIGRRALRLYKAEELPPIPPEPEPGTFTPPEFLPKSEEDRESGEDSSDSSLGPIGVGERAKVFGDDPDEKAALDMPDEERDRRLEEAKKRLEDLEARTRKPEEVDRGAETSSSEEILRRRRRRTEASPVDDTSTGTPEDGSKPEGPEEGPRRRRRRSETSPDDDMPTGTPEDVPKDESKPEEIGRRPGGSDSERRPRRYRERPEAAPTEDDTDDGSEDGSYGPLPPPPEYRTHRPSPPPKELSKREKRKQEKERLKNFKPPNTIKYGWSLIEATKPENIKKLKKERKEAKRAERKEKRKKNAEKRRARAERRHGSYDIFGVSEARHEPARHAKTEDSGVFRPGVANREPVHRGKANYREAFRNGGAERRPSYHEDVGDSGMSRPEEIVHEPVHRGKANYREAFRNGGAEREPSRYEETGGRSEETRHETVHRGKANYREAFRNGGAGREPSYREEADVREASGSEVAEREPSYPSAEEYRRGKTERRLGFFARAKESLKRFNDTFSIDLEHAGESRRERRDRLHREAEEKLMARERARIIRESRAFDGINLTEETRDSFGYRPDGGYYFARNREAVKPPEDEMSDADLGEPVPGWGAATGNPYRRYGESRSWPSAGGAEPRPRVARTIEHGAPRSRYERLPFLPSDDDGDISDYDGFAY